MKLDRKDLLLYAVTDRTWLKGQVLSTQVEQALKGGATLIQLREKDLEKKKIFEELKQIKKLCKQYKVPLIINDYVEMVLKGEADGIHVGPKDMDAGEVRKLIGEDKILGVSVQTVEGAIQAEQKGADYLGVGAVFPTNSKKDARRIEIKQLQEICKAVKIPVVAIGGMNEGNIEQLKGTGISGVAVIRAIFSSSNIAKSTAHLKQLVQRNFG